MYVLFNYYKTFRYLKDKIRFFYLNVKYFITLIKQAVYDDYLINNINLEVIN